MAEPLAPETARLLARLALGLAVLAGVLFTVAFGLGVAREGVVRWWVLALAAPFLFAPWLVRRAR